MASGEAKRKGDLLEDLVTILYKLSPGKVFTRKMVPCMDEPDQKREVDVLVVPMVTGYPAPIAIECKNEKNAVGVERIDAFVGKLEDIGIPSSRGIYVSPKGYTTGAKRRAKKCGIQLLVFDGLTPDRLAAALNNALFIVGHYLLFIESVDIFPYLPSSASGEPWPLDQETTEDAVYNEIWKRWVSGAYDYELGSSRVYFRGSPGGAVVESRVRAYVGTIIGQSSQLLLREADGDQTIRAKLMAEFEVPSSVELEMFESRSQLLEWQKTEDNGTARITAMVRVPRIVTGSVFYPPSRDAASRIHRLRKAGEPVTFATVEGDDLARAWDFYARV